MKTLPAFKKVTIPSLILMFLFASDLALAAILACSNIFSPQADEALIQKIQIPLDKTIAELSALRLEIDLNKAQNVHSVKMTAIENEYRKKESQLIDHLEKYNIMSSDQLATRMRQEIQKLQTKSTLNETEKSRLREEHEGKIKNHKVDGTKLIAHRIEPGSFKMGEVGKHVETTLTKPFEMMSVPTTQIVWRKIVEIAGTTFPGKYRINPDPSHFKGDTRPVERVSYKDVQNWIKMLNELSALGEGALVDVLPGHKQGDTYRLPTEAEWEFVMRGRGLYNDQYHFGKDEALLHEYAWYEGNSDKQTHPVGQKKPLLVGDKDFYDMHGNVWEWVYDWYSPKLSGTVNSKPTALLYRVIRGGSFRSCAIGLTSCRRINSDPEKKAEYTGFRLVRETPQ